MTAAQGLTVIQDILKESRKLISSKRRWTQGFCLDEKNQPISCFHKRVVKFNTLGAVAFTTKKFGYNEKFADSVTSVLKRCVPSIGRDWNSREHIYPSLSIYLETATHDQVVKLFDNAIELMRGSTHEGWLPLNYSYLRSRKVSTESVSQ